MSKYSENMPDDINAAIGWMFGYIEDGKSLLDFGCSTGYFGSYIKNQKKCRVVGVEISDDKKEAVKVLDKVMSFDIDADWPKEINKEKFDYIFFGDVIEHLKDPSSALKKASELLNENGMIFVSTPNVAHISVRLELLEGNFEYEPMGILDNTHLKYFTRKSLNKVVGDAGLYIFEESMSTNDIPNEIITERLNKIGVKALDRFWEEVKKPEARAYQYKLVLKKSTKNNSKTIDGLSDKPLQYRDDHMKMLKMESEKLLEHANEQAKIISNLEDKINKEKLEKEIQKKEKEKLEKEISLIKNSRLWKLRSKIKGE